MNTSSSRAATKSPPFLRHSPSLLFDISFILHPSSPPSPHPQNRDPFVVPDAVPWPQLAEALNCFCHAHTGRGLIPQNLDYLGRKLLGIGVYKSLKATSCCVLVFMSKTFSEIVASYETVSASGLMRAMLPVKETQVVTL